MLHNEAVYWKRQGINLHEAKKRLKSSILFRTFSTVDTNILEHKLASKGFVFNNNSPQLIVAVVDSMIDHRLDELNTISLKNKVPLFVTKPTGIVAKYALFNSDSGCWKCFKYYYLLQNPVISLVHSRNKPGTDLYWPLAYTDSSVELMLLESAQYIEQYFIHKTESVFSGKLFLRDFQTGDTSLLDINPSSSCRSCSKKNNLSICLGNIENLDTNYNLVTNTPQETHEQFIGLTKTFDKIKNQKGRHTGIIRDTYLINLPIDDPPFFICISKHPVITDNTTLKNVLTNLSHQSSAIARTPIEAEILSMCEALERWSCVYNGQEFATLKSIDELGQGAIHPQQIHGFSNLQYEHRKEINRQSTNMGDYVPEFLHENIRISWGKGFSLTKDKRRYLPLSSSYYGWHDNGHIYSLADSRGVAAGASITESVWNGLCELVETDAVAIWNANQLLKPLLDIKSFDSSFFDKLIEVHQNLGRELYALDITADIDGLFVVCAISLGKHDSSIIRGYGTSVSVQTALCRALMECSQMLPNVLRMEPSSESPIRLIASFDRKQGKVLSSMNYLSQRTAHLTKKNIKDVRTKNDYPQKSKITNLADLIAILSEKKIEVIVQNMTKPETGIYVTRTFAIGLRSWFARWAPGRLFSVPVDMEILRKPYSEEQINEMYEPIF